MTNSHDLLLHQVLTEKIPGFSKRSTPERQHLPQIIINNRQLRDITSDSLHVVKQANCPPTLFRHSSGLVRLLESGTIEPLTVSSLRGILARVADYIRVNKNDSIQNTNPPIDIVKDILSLPPEEVPLPWLHGLRSSPVLLRDGRFLSEKGYDPVSGLFLLSGLDGIRTDIPINEARRLLVDELLVDFPFDGGASLANTVALILQPFVRDYIDGPTPMYLIDAPTRGTGKGLLADIATRIYRGKTVATMTITSSGDELEKRITANLLSGQDTIIFDNVTELRSNHLASVLTTTEWSGRRLGVSHVVNLPNEATWIATGNNVELSDEMVRRVVLVRLDAGVERPEERSGFRHSLPKWADENRAMLVSACVSIVSAWVGLGCPRGDSNLGRFESWAEVMSGILSIAGVPDLLENRAYLSASADEKTRDWISFCKAWYGKFGSQPIKAGSLLGILTERNLLIDIWADRSKQAAMQRLGWALRRKRDRVFGGLQVRSAGPDRETKSATHRLVPVTEHRKGV